MLKRALTATLSAQRGPGQTTSKESARVSAHGVTSARKSLEASAGVCRRGSRWKPPAVYMSVGEVNCQPTLTHNMIMAPHGPETAAHGSCAKRMRCAAAPIAHHQSLSGGLFIQAELAQVEMSPL
eukprot:3956469-Amphidinium_carterae.1